MKKIYIYTLKDPITNQIRYVGKTNKLQERYYNHLGNNNPKSHKSMWIKSLKNKDLKPIMEIIDEVNYDNWKFYEQYWISQLKTWGFNLTNHTCGGDGITFANSGSFKKGVIPWNNNINIKLKPDKKVYQYNSITGYFIKEWKTAKEASIELNINQEAIGQCCRGKLKSSGGYTWSYNYYDKISPVVYSGKTNNKIKNNLKY